VCDEYRYAGSSWCDGDKLVSCHDGVLETTDCGDLDQECRHWSNNADGGGSTSTWCGTGKECSEGSYCIGDTAVLCDEDAQEEMISFDCTIVGPEFTCLPIPEEKDVMCALPPDQRECEAGEAFCEGDNIRLCLGGKLLTVDCSTFLNASCEEEPEDRYDEGWFDFGDDVRCVAQ